MIVAVTGGRDLVVGAALAQAWTNALVVHCRGGHGSALIVRHGACSGLDSWIDTWCQRSWGVIPEVWYADWARYGRAAGPIRNRRMLAGQHSPGEIVRLSASILFAFPGGRGTADCIKAAGELGIPVVEVRP